LVGLVVAGVIAALIVPLLPVGRVPHRSRWASKPTPRRVAVAAVIALAGSDGDAEESLPPLVSPAALSDLGLTNQSLKVKLRAHNGVMGHRSEVETVVRRE
jgi:hypothetical protein